MKPKVIVFASTLLVWAMAAGAAVFWLLNLHGMSRGSTERLNANDLLVVSEPTTRAASAAELATLLGQKLPLSEAKVEAPSRFKLVGVVAQGQGGVALLAVDDQPPSPYRVGSSLDEKTVLQAVGLRHVVLAADSFGAAGLRLELPAEPSQD